MHHVANFVNKCKHTFYTCNVRRSVFVVVYFLGQSGIFPTTLVDTVYIVSFDVTASACLFTVVELLLFIFKTMIHSCYI